MSFIGKLHEICFYGLLSSIFAVASGLTTTKAVFYAAFHVSCFTDFFLAYLFWASIAYIPIALIGAIITKNNDDGLYFHSDNILVIIFAHIAEELLGLFASPIWFLKDLFKRELNDGWKIFDYITYAIELVFIFIGFSSLT